ncbi:MAG: helix-turn-helix domain-containing protein [Candidatus Paceibacterota bacterium]
MRDALTPLPLAPVPRLALRRAEAAAALGVSDRTLDMWTRSGDIPHIRRGGCLLYPVAELAEWLAAQAAEGEL